ncbi:hypothetical protein TIFTF001_002091 [Ficus carica]|uniref:Uncharacterized protein n=1 Tax=Ficus carica TaxID=3494 RepID=A0AA87Z2V6_FICCA|nr:hypothetical protein TIFTF001_002091 [Ficus carica]
MIDFVNPDLEYCRTVCLHHSLAKRQADLVMIADRLLASFVGKEVSRSRDDMQSLRHDC